MVRNSLSLEIDDNGGAGRDGNHNANNVAGNGDTSFHSIRDRLRLKRNSSDRRDRSHSGLDRPSLRTRPHHIGRSLNRKGLLSLLKPRGTCLLYFLVAFTVCAFVMSSLLLQNSITWQGNVKGGQVRSQIGLGSTLKYVPGGIARTLIEGKGLDPLRSAVRIGVRPPRLALVLGNMKKDPRTLMLVTVMKNLQKLGYVFKVFAVENGEARSLWEQLAGHVKVLVSEQLGHADWTIFEGVIADSLEAKEAISSLMQEPFRSVPLIWIVHEDILANRLPVYQRMGQNSLISHWRSAFARADVVVFPQFTLPMLHSVLDDGNFVVIPESVVDVWAAESYSETHTKQNLREINEFGEDDVIILVLGSSFFYDEFSWDNAVAMHMLGPLLTRYGRRKDTSGSFKFVFLYGNSTKGQSDAVQEVASRLGLTEGTVRHFGLNEDVNRVLRMADILVYASSQEEQNFPPLIVRAMSFGIPIITPDFPIMKKYMADEVHGIFFRRNDPDALLKAFSPLISDGRLSKFAQTIASSGRLLTKNLMATECITGYARLLENMLHFPSDTFLPGSISQLQVAAWEWNFFRSELEQPKSFILDSAYAFIGKSGIVFQVEEKFMGVIESTNPVDNNTLFVSDELPSKLDWDVLEEIEGAEEYEKVESEELEDRMERDVEDWEEIYRNARKSEKLKFEVNERDEGELERTGEPLCIYEIYNGAGAWPFLHHGSLYRGLSLSSKDRRLSSDDVDAADRLPLLNDTYYRDILCEIGGMFSVANKVDSIHMRPWIGFQSWRAAGRKVSLSSKAEESLENIIKQETKGEIIYFWTRLDIDGDAYGSKNALTFWSMCDILNQGNCRTTFEDAFRHMYGLPEHIEALPPMPEDGHHWSSLHNWVMPTPSFLEFVMFSRMFSESLDALHNNLNDSKSCSLASSLLERKHCYCRVLELLVNVWAYHSGRKMVYINPRDGSLEEQHPLQQRKGLMWAKYFNFTLLKSMDEDLAEAADDKDHPRERWLWPLTGEVHWKGVYEREREERYRLKMDKKRKTKEKLYDRIKNGYKQKSLGG
ncbi:UDP-Glycosyltransferase superfamily protein [Arabidopsis thaliana]|uniref:AT5g04480/T32M21_80 n=1 Tax=Arabidopsis thaliana TaxID=3702 RepID=Q940Y7_ARATH|eukprot:NP_568137.1 UDP-Glycosyltransferase superfamily protein [Arabidopsis thaliana]